jgi:hypothetical protein
MDERQITVHCFEGTGAKDARDNRLVGAFSHFDVYHPVIVGDLRSDAVLGLETGTIKVLWFHWKRSEEVGWRGLLRVATTGR